MIRSIATLIQSLVAKSRCFIMRVSALLSVYTLVCFVSVFRLIFIALDVWFVDFPADLSVIKLHPLVVIMSYFLPCMADLCRALIYHVVSSVGSPLL